MRCIRCARRLGCCWVFVAGTSEAREHDNYSLMIFLSRSVLCIVEVLARLCLVKPRNSSRSGEICSMREGFRKYPAQEALVGLESDASNDVKVSKACRLSRLPMEIRHSFLPLEVQFRWPKIPRTKSTISRPSFLASEGRLKGWSIAGSANSCVYKSP